MTEMGLEQVESLERGLAGAGRDVAGTEAGEVGPADPEAGLEADAWLSDSAGQRPADWGGESLQADLADEITEPGEAGPAEAAREALPDDPGPVAGDFGAIPGDLGQAAGSVERGLSGDLGQATGDISAAIGSAGSAERVASTGAGDAMRSVESTGKGVAEGMATGAAGAARSAGSAGRIMAADAGHAMESVAATGSDIAGRAGQLAESILPGGDATGAGREPGESGPQPAEPAGPRIEPGLAHDDTQAKPARSGPEAPGDQGGLRLDLPQAPDLSPRSQPR
jgi:hypothetical protein